MLITYNRFVYYKYNIYCNNNKFIVYLFGKILMGFKTVVTSQVLIIYNTQLYIIIIIILLKL
jgi:hypothetical protein